MKYFAGYGNAAMPLNLQPKMITFSTGRCMPENWEIKLWCSFLIFSFEIVFSCRISKFKKTGALTKWWRCTRRLGNEFQGKIGKGAST